MNDSTHGKRRKLAATAVFAVFIFAILATSGAAAPIEKKNVSTEIREESGTTDMMGGGDYYYVRFANDAAFGVIWGTEEHQNSIYLVVIHTRYLGAADVYDKNGAKLANDYPIRVLTVFGTKLLDIFEYNDTNGNGYCSGIRVGDGLTYKDYITHEPIYKGVSMNTAWTNSEVKKGGDDKTKTYEFSLTAKNLSYMAIGNSSTIASDVAGKNLDMVQFTFHLSASLVEVDGVAVPQYKVTVQKRAEGGYGGGYRNRYEVVASERMPDLNYSGKRGSYDMKWDHAIDGWDFDPTNVNKSLVLEWYAFMAYFIPETTQEWLDAQFMQKTGGEGCAEYDTDIGRRTANRTDIQKRLPERVNGKYVNFSGNWTKVGRFKWISDVIVDGKTVQMTAQIQGGRPFDVTGGYGNRMVGFAVLGGFSYPGGAKIFHDPGMDGTVLIDMENTASPFRLIVIGGVFLVVVAVVAVALYLSLGKRRIESRRGFEDCYDTQTNNQQNENANDKWQEYYTRK